MLGEGCYHADMKINYSAKLVKNDGVVIIPVLENDTLKHFTALADLDVLKTRL